LRQAHRNIVTTGKPYVHDVGNHTGDASYDGSTLNLNIVNGFAAG
jgi:hypothetical protein